MCLFRRLGLSNVLPQTLQGSIVFSFGLLPGPVLATVCCALVRERRGLIPGARRKPGGGPEGRRGGVAEGRERAGSRKLRWGAGCCRKGLFIVSERKGDIGKTFWDMKLIRSTYTDREFSKSPTCPRDEFCLWSSKV